MKLRKDPLPIDAVLPELRAKFQNHHVVILSADPGAGKTTRVPLALFNEPWLNASKILMLEPRRLAAQRSASYMASLLGEQTGETVGYRIRGETKVGKSTRIEVVTEGILTRMLQDDPSLDGVGLVIFDEFHERSIHADLGLAFALDTQSHLRPDLRILIMSATIDVERMSLLIEDGATVKSEGKSFPVVTHYLQRPPDEAIETSMLRAIGRALRETSGDVLAFLPGQREIRRVAEAATGTLSGEVEIHLLYGEAGIAQQQAALLPSTAGRRKIILATNVAETSLTIDGVRVVVDSGLSRQSRFDPSRGMAGLVTVPVSKSSADQRRGRAGRQAPGTCYRLWSEQQHAHLAEFSQPEILAADLAPFALELAQWGSPDGAGLRFLDPPPSAHLAQAQQLLADLGALDAERRLTAHGRAMASLPIHPRLAHMLLKGRELGLGPLACDVAAMLEERDLLRGELKRDIDVHSRWYALRKSRSRDLAVQRVRAQSDRLRKLIGVSNEQPKEEEKLGILIALAYPERIGQQREANGLRYQLSGGSGALLPKGSDLIREKYLAIAEVDGVGTEVKVFLAEPVSKKELEDVFADRIVTKEEVRWDERQQCVVARRVTRLGELELSETPLTANDDAVRAALIDGLRGMGLGVLPWTKHAASIRRRSEWLRKQSLVDNNWPDLSDERLLASLEDWLGPYLDGNTKRTHLQRLDLNKIIEAMYSYQQLRELERLAPTHLTVPTGSHIPIDYESGDVPILAVRLQEMFGQTETPGVGGGKVKVLLHLLSPALRPLAVTQDLPSFWKNAYPDVRKDMRGRYPKHHWPENPLEAEPTKKAKRRR